MSQYLWQPGSQLTLFSFGDRPLFPSPPFNVRVFSQACKFTFELAAKSMIYDVWIESRILRYDFYFRRLLHSTFIGRHSTCPRKVLLTYGNVKLKRIVSEMTHSYCSSYRHRVLCPFVVHSCTPNWRIRSETNFSF